MRSREVKTAQSIAAALLGFSKTRKLPGIASSTRQQALVEQIVESMRRVRYVSVILMRPPSELRGDPSSDLFDPLKAAILRMRVGDIEEAFWLVFLFVHFGKSGRTGWHLVRDVYGRLGETPKWDWAHVRANPRGFREWLAKHERRLRGADGVKRQFGNHRKFETLKESSNRGTGKVIESYVRWVKAAGGHQTMIQNVMNTAKGDPRLAFDYLYNSMSVVLSFGRTAKFDFLTMLGKLGLAPIQAPSTYMNNATGPLKGARLLFGGDTSSPLGWKELDSALISLESILCVGPQGMQVIEDALCNWQKSPDEFKAFRG